MPTPSGDGNADSQGESDDRGPRGGTVNWVDPGGDTAEENGDGDATLPTTQGDTSPVPRQSTELDRRAETTALETGRESIDEKFDGGFVPGSIVAVEGDPRSKSDVVLSNLVPKTSPVYYFAGTAATSRVDGRIDRTKLIPPEDRHIFDTAGWDLDALRETVGDLSLERQSTIVVDPLTMFERGGDREAYVQLMRTLRLAIGTHSLCLVHCPTPEATPAYRWITLDRADTIFEVRHVAGRDSPNVLSVARLHPDQTFDTEAREFDIQGDREVDLVYDESISTPTG